MIKVWKKENDSRRYFVRLFDDWDPTPRLVLVNEDGEPIEGCVIVELTERGTLKLCRSIDENEAEKAGLQIDDDGYVVTEKE